jgi:hypothetical protein
LNILSLPAAVEEEVLVLETLIQVPAVVPVDIELQQVFQ